jgi:hypothetical protein
MPKVVAVNFIRVAWNYSPQPDKPPFDSDAKRRVNGLDSALLDLEIEIDQALEEGWAMEGSVAYINPDKVDNGGGNAGLTHLVQKMVKYEEPPQEVKLEVRRKAKDNN